MHTKSPATNLLRQGPGYNPAIGEIILQRYVCPLRASSLPLF